MRSGGIYSLSVLSEGHVAATIFRGERSAGGGSCYSHGYTQQSYREGTRVTATDQLNHRPERVTVSYRPAEPQTRKGYSELQTS